MAKLEELTLEEIKAILEPGGKCPPMNETQASWNTMVLLCGIINAVGEGLDITELIAAIEALCEKNEKVEDGETITTIDALCNIEETIENLPNGIEQGIAAVGCTKDEDGKVNGSVFLCKTSPDDDSGDPAVIELLHIATDGTQTRPWSGVWEPCEEASLVLECYQQQYTEGGLDNTKTNFTHTNQLFTVGFSDGTGGTFPIASASDWSDQVTQMATGLSGLMPWAAQVGPFCTNGCGGLPVPAVTLSSMILRYAGFRVCPGDPIPTSVTYTSDQVKKPVNLVIQAIPTPTILWDRCVNCETGADTWRNAKTKEVYVPTEENPCPPCTIPCTQDFPEVPEPDCTPLPTVEVCEIEPGATNPDQSMEPDTVFQSGIFISYLQCGANIEKYAYTINADGDIEDHTLTAPNWYGDCETLEEIVDPIPTCPEGAVFLPYEQGGHYAIQDNSNYVGSPTPHITNGQNFEFTYVDAGGTPLATWQQTADPLFNNFIQTLPAAMGCAVKPGCANHTSPKGCNASHVANLAMYPAYDPPTYPADIQNNLTNPAQSEAWASHWILDCGDCDPKPARVIITNANDPAYIGAYKDLIWHDKEKTTIWMAMVCGAAYFQDCEGNPVAAPACCPAPRSVEDETLGECETCEGNRIFQTYATTPYTITGVTIGGEDQSAHFSGLPVNGTSFIELTTFRDELLACLTALGIQYTIRYGRDGWLIEWDGPQAVLAQDNGDQVSSDDCEKQAFRYVGMTDCDKLFWTQLFNGCEDPCPPRTTADAVCNDTEQVVNGVTIPIGAPIIRKTTDYFKQENCVCVLDETIARFFDFNDPATEFTDPVAFTGECDFETTTSERCDRNGNPITVTVISVNVSDGISVQTSYGDVNGNPIPEPLLPLSICDPQVQAVKGCVINDDGTKTTGILHLQYDQAANPGYDVSTFVADGDINGKPLGTRKWSCDCEPKKECSIPKNKFTYDFGERFPGCTAPTILVNGEVVELCPPDSTGGVVPTSGDICTTGGVRSYAGAASDGRCGRPSGLLDDRNAAAQLLNGGTYTPGGTSQYNNTSIAVNGSFALSGPGGILTFAGTGYNPGSAGISFYVRDCVSGDTLPTVTTPPASLDNACNAIIPNSATGGFGGTAGPFSIQWDATGYQLENLVIETIVQGPNDTFGGITLQNGNGPAVPFGPQTCSATTLQELDQLLDGGTGDDWFVNGNSLCVISEDTYGALTCGEDPDQTVYTPTVTDATTTEEIPKIAISECDIKALTLPLIEKLCAIEEALTGDGECPCKDCPELVVGPPTDTGTQVAYTTPINATDQFINWASQVSITEEECLTDNPNALITIRVTQDHEAGAYDSHRSYVLTTSAGVFTAVSGTNTAAAASGTAGQQIGYAAGDSANGPRAIRWVELEVPVQDLFNSGISLTAIAFGGAGGAFEILHSQTIEIVDGLNQICDQC